MLSIVDTVVRFGSAVIVIAALGLMGFLGIIVRQLILLGRRVERFEKDDQD